MNLPNQLAMEGINCNSSYMEL